MLRITLDGIDEKTIFDTEDQTIVIQDDEGKTKHTYHLTQFHVDYLCTLAAPFMGSVGDVENWLNATQAQTDLFMKD